MPKGERQRVGRGIYRLDGFYIAEFYDQFKKRHRKRCTTLQFARRYLATKKNEVWQNQFDPASVRSEKNNLTFDSLVKDRLDASKAQKQYPAEKGRMNWWKKRFNNCLVSSLTHQAIDNALGDLLKSGRTPATRNRYLGSLKATFNLAKTNEKIERDPSIKVKGLQENNKKDRWLKPSEEKKLMEVMPLRDQLLVKIALNTGLRKKVLLSLKWADIDFTTHKITLRDPKSGVDQYQPFYGTAFEALKELKNMPLQDVSGDVFWWTNQWKGNPNNKLYPKWDKAWKKYCSLAGIENCRFHDLRHSFASRLATANVNPVVVKELMRHSSIETTMRYMHLAPSANQRALGILEKVYTEPEIWEENDLQQPSVQPSVKTVNS